MESVVLLQPDQAYVTKVPLKLPHVLHFGPAPAVDALVIVAHRKHVAVASQGPHQLVLGLVGILKLVHQDELESFPIPGQPVGVVPEQVERVEHQVVEVHRVEGPEPPGEGAHHVGGDFGDGVLRGGSEQRFSALHPVLGSGDDGLNEFR